MPMHSSYDVRNSVQLLYSRIQSKPFHHCERRGSSEILIQELIANKSNSSTAESGK